LGAAYLAGIGVGFFNGLHDIQEHWKVEREFTPQMKESERMKLTKQWRKAINASVAWSEEI
jgi:glycerol kinase